MRNSAFDFFGRIDEFMILFFHAESILELRGLEEAKNQRGNVRRLIQIRFSDDEFEKMPSPCQGNPPQAGASTSFEI